MLRDGVTQEIIRPLNVMRRRAGDRDDRGLVHHALYDALQLGEPGRRDILHDHVKKIPCDSVQVDVFLLSPQGESVKARE